MAPHLSVRQQLARPGRALSRAPRPMTRTASTTAQPLQPRSRLGTRRRPGIRANRSATGTWTGSLFVGERATECQVPGNCLVSMGGCMCETDALPRVTCEEDAMGRARRRVVLVVAAGVLAAGLGGMAAAGAAAAAPATGQASAAVTLSSNPVLFGVSAVSRSDAWAVGRQNSTGVFKTLILHWNGSAWSKVNSPSPSLADAELMGVSAVSGSDAWAVGWYWNRAGTATQTLILHWNGTAWRQVKSPNAPRYTDFGLTGVSAVSGSDAWAVGVRGVPSDGGKSGTLIFHWDGMAWTLVPSPSPGSGTNLLEGVSAVSGSDAWAV